MNWKQTFAVPITALLGGTTMLGLGIADLQSARADGSVVPNVSCNSALPCLQKENAGMGAGIKGISDKGSGVVGLTKFVSTSAANAKAGVFGLDKTTTGVLDMGVLGQSTNGTGVFGQSNAGIGVQANSSNFIGALVVGGLFDAAAGDNFPALSIVDSFAGGNYTDLIDACRPSSFTSLCYNGNALFSVGSGGGVTTTGSIFSTGSGFFFGSLSVGGATPPVSGDVNITGQYLKNNLCVAGCTISTPNSPGRGVASYATQETMPTMEDFGEGRLVNGQAVVHISADFANVIDARATYMVFITPEGESHGLYVTHKTNTGFAVMENSGGRSTIAFSYRIVAKPFGAERPRLPMLSLQPARLRSSKGHNDG